MNQQEHKKIISFSYSDKGLKQLELEVERGWKIINIISNGNIYSAILEKSSQEGFYIPPRKNIQISG